eukprot:scaffold1042_cov220-Skeletonema_menzelii.AAC.3
MELQSSSMTRVISRVRAFLLMLADYLSEIVQNRCVALSPRETQSPRHGSRQRQRRDIALLKAVI